MIRSVLTIGVVIVAVLGLFWFVIVKNVDSWDERGQFGDMFGAVNALFSGLAFAGVIIALVYQRRELELQRQELRETRKEIGRSAKAEEGQASSLQAQASTLRMTAELNARAALLQAYMTGVTYAESKAADQVAILESRVSELEAD